MSHIKSIHIKLQKEIIWLLCADMNDRPIETKKVMIYDFNFVVSLLLLQVNADKCKVMADCRR